MDLLFRHRQEKKDRKSESLSVCTLELYSDETFIVYSSVFDLDFHRYGTKKHITFDYTLHINLNDGDINVTYKIINQGLTDDKMFRNNTTSLKNDFDLLNRLIEDGFYRGEKRKDYWGVKYKKAQNSILKIFHKTLKSRIKSEFLKDKQHEHKYIVSELFDLIVDFHLDMKNIKGHDGVYLDIQEVYPKKKWLKLNDNKFLPAVLDYYGIKSKYLVSKLNENDSKVIHIKSLNYLCKLFGDEYIDYIKKVNWQNHCYQLPPNNKIHRLNNDSEKNFMVSLLNSWDKNPINAGTFMSEINKLLSLKESLESRGIKLKFNAGNINQFEHLEKKWTSIKLHFSRGFKVKYKFDNTFLKTIEQDIVIDGQKYKVRVLTSEDDFLIESHIMKNCMSQQFVNGIAYIYMSMSLKRKRINLQYRRGELTQSYGKANTSVPEFFNSAIEILNNRMSNFKDITWIKERYDYLMS